MRNVIKSSRQRGIARAALGVGSVLTLLLAVSCAGGGASPTASFATPPRQFVDTWSETLPAGTPLFAMAAGTVVRVTDVFKTAVLCPGLDRSVDAQKAVLIAHTLSDGHTLHGWYSHLDRIDVGVGASVAAGQQIGLSENTACSGSPHLHFEVASQTPQL